MEFMDRLEKDPESLLDLTVAELAKRGGWEGAEVVMWLMMRGALSEKVEVTHKTYFLPSMTPIATMIFEEASNDAPVESAEKTRERAWHDYAGVGRPRRALIRSPSSAGSRAFGSTTSFTR